jgi:hypothetical protein
MRAGRPRSIGKSAQLSRFQRFTQFPIFSQVRLLAAFEFFIINSGNGRSGFWR